MKSKILLIVEGEKEELRILGKASHGLLSLIGAEYEIVSFANPIYELYDAYQKGKYDDIVSYLRYEKGLQLPKNVLSKNAFSAIYLVFDFEVQDHKYSDEKIKQLLELFNNETELGKLYINYPMVESYYHLEKLPDNNYNDRVVDITNLNGKKYKKMVYEATCLKKNLMTNRELCFIIMQNYNKAIYITNQKQIDHKKVLEVQLERKKEKNEIFVLSMFPFIVLDYNLSRTMEILKLKLKKNFMIINVEEISKVTV